MPITNQTLNNNLYDNLYAQGYKPDPLDSIGKEADIDAADVFRLHFTDDDGEEGNAWMAVVDGELVLWADNDFINMSKYENFNKFWKTWAQKQTLRWKVTNRDRLVGDMKKRTVMKKKEDQLNEGYYALGKQRSYSDSIPTVKLIIQHTRQLEEGEQRFRNIAKIFVENTGGERFLLPTNRPGLARVFARHIAEGGTPYDDKGRHITSLVEEYTQMAGFVRATRNGQFNESALRLVNEGLMHYNNLRMTLQGMSSHRGYNKYFESYTPVLNEEADDDVSLNELFVEETLDPRIENVMPILKRLSKNITEMSEVKELDEWAKSITEVEDETTKTLAVPADEMLEDLDGELDEGLGSKLLVGAALIATLWGINYKQAQEVYSNSPQLQKLEQLHTQAVKMGDDAKAKELEQRIGDHKTRLDLGYGEVMGKGGVPKEIKEAPGAMTLKHNQNTEKSNLKAFDLAEKFDPAQKSELADLIDQYQSSTDPEADYYYDGDVPDSDEILNTIRQKFGDKIADTLDKGTNKMHYGRDDKDFGYDPLADRKGPRVTKSGMANKQDIQALKTAMKDKNLFKDKELKPNLPESHDEHNPVAIAVTRRIIMQRPDLLEKFGPAAVTQAIDDVAEFAGDVEEIGSSDVSGWVKQVERQLGGVTEGMAEGDPKSHQAQTTLKHLKKASYGDRADAANIKPGVAGYRDRIDMLQRAEKEGNLKEEDVAEDLDANQKRVGQLGPTEKVKNNNIGKLVGANESVELSEMDKSQKSSDRGGESSGDPYAKGGKATPVKAKDMAKDSEKTLTKAMDKADKKDVKEGQEDLDAILRIVRK